VVGRKSVSVGSVMSGRRMTSSFGAAFAFGLGGGARKPSSPGGVPDQTFKTAGSAALACNATLSARNVNNARETADHVLERENCGGGGE